MQYNARRFSCMTNVSLVSSFETYLFPPFQELIDQKSEGIV